MMNIKKEILFISILFLCIALGFVSESNAQYTSRFGGAAGGYGGYGGYGNYGSSGGYGGYGSSGYGGSRGGFGSFSGSRGGLGGGFSSRGYGGSGYGGYGGYGNSGYGGYGTSGYGGFGGGRSRGRSGRSSRRSGGGYGNSYGGYGNTGGYNAQSYGGSRGNYGSSRGRGRSGSRYGNYGNSSYGGQVPNTAINQPGQPRQTTPGGSSSDRRRALTGKTSVRGAAPITKKSSSGASSGLQVQGAVKSRTPSKSPASKGPTPAKGKASPQRRQPETKMRSSATLYMDCASPLAVINQPKVVHVLLANNNLEYDRLAFALQYDPDDLMPVMGQDAAGKWTAATSIPFPRPAVSSSTKKGSSPQSSADESTFFTRNPSRYEITKNTINTLTGVITFELKVKKGTSKDGGVVATLTFLPLRETNTTLSFFFSDPDAGSVNQPPLTALSLGTKDQLGSSYNATDGIVNLDLTIYESLEKARRPMRVKKAGESGIDDALNQDSYGIRLVLVPRQQEVNVGDTIDIDVVLSNPRKEELDTVNLLIAYNSRVFEAVDGDDFTPGINIADQDYKQNFPFDFPILNTIDTDRGIVDFRKKTMRKTVHEEGILATIRLKAIRPTRKTTFRIFLNETGEEPTTGLFYKNMDRLGDPADPFDGVSTCSITVRPTTAYLKQFRSREGF